MNADPILWAAPTTKAQRAEFVTLDECDQRAMREYASKLYDGTRTASACWRAAFDWWQSLAITDPAEIEQIKARLQYTEGEYDTEPTTADW